MDNLYTKVMGKGVLFPIQLTKNEKGEVGWYPVNGNINLLYNNLSALLWYDIGQRIRQEDFGTRLWECIEEPNTQALSFLVRDFIKQSFDKYESRITFLDAKTSRKDAKIHIEMRYKLNETGETKTSQATFDLLSNQLNT